MNILRLDFDCFLIQGENVRSPVSNFSGPQDNEVRDLRISTLRKGSWHDLHTVPRGGIIDIPEQEPGLKGSGFEYYMALPLRSRSFEIFHPHQRRHLPLFPGLRCGRANEIVPFMEQRIGLTSLVYREIAFDPA